MIESFYYSSLLFKVSALAYLLVLMAYLAAVFVKKRWMGKASLALFGAAFLICSALIASRWIAAGRPPFKSLYESLVFAVWTISLVSLVAEWRFRVKLVGLLSSLGIAGILLFSLSKRDVEIIALPPALQTWMFIPHVISYFVAYGALFVAGLGAVLHLFFPGGMASHHTLGEQEKIDFSVFTYQIAKLGFLFLTAGLLLGAWWGQNAWSNYWAWDPKENWALVTWLVFAAYLHLRNIGSMDGRKLAWVVIAGVLAVVFTYLGMDYLPTAGDSLHTYSGN
ncbi:MAG: cytochrome c biogenesis protein CcsA [Lewinellaceae bacterium]|nr:cytochrome c biogenesis protein CcsA [Saprospiraceae bacterium]MCB9341239.1 cytochrome c biogenesis protein CcsA [Lewinellaceae bacterium]